MINSGWIRSGCIAAIGLGAVLVGKADTIYVTSLEDPGIPGDKLITLREAIESANAAGIPMIIAFDASLMGGTIQPLSQLPTITGGDITIDGDIDANGVPDIEIDGSQAPSAQGLNVASNGNTLRGLTINRFALSAIRLDGTANNVVTCCYLGTDATGSLARPNMSMGIMIRAGATDNSIGPHNVISGNVLDGIHIRDIGSDRNTVIGNVIGLDATGLNPIGNLRNGIAIFLGASANTVGGISPDDRNVVSANGRGIIIAEGTSETPTSGNSVLGNYIGLDATGTTAAGNQSAGVALLGPSPGVTGNQIGPSNVISGNNSVGVLLSGEATRLNTVIRNRIGTNALGDRAVPNGSLGIVIQDNSHDNILGPGNVISGNLTAGVLLDAAADNLIVGNLIGTDAAGETAIGNQGAGLTLRNGSTGNRVGSEFPGEENTISGNVGVGLVLSGEETRQNAVIRNRIGTNALGDRAVPNGSPGVIIGDGAHENVLGPGNVISGNDSQGVAITSQAHDNHVIGNLIGTDASGTARIPNFWDGIVLQSGAHHNVIGEVSNGNVCSGNRASGILIRGTGADFNIIEGNLIGSDITGTQPLPNNTSGVSIRSGASNNRIGPGNLISGNSVSYGVGIAVQDAGSDNNLILENLIGTDIHGVLPLPNNIAIEIDDGASDNEIRSNTMWFNTVRAVWIDQPGTRRNTLTRNSITSNGGPGIELTNGSNEGITPPRIEFITSSEVLGTASSADGSVVELFNDPADEGLVYLGSTTLTNGHFRFVGDIPATGSINATVTDPDGNTSSFGIHRRGVFQIVITGDACVPENSVTQFEATAYSFDVGPQAITNFVSWSVVPDTFASIDSFGRLTTTDIPSNQRATLRASIEFKNVEFVSTLDIVLVDAAFGDCNQNNVADDCELVGGDIELLAGGMLFPEDIVLSVDPYPPGFFVPDAFENLVYHVSVLGDRVSPFTFGHANPVGAVMAPPEFMGNARLFVANRRASPEIVVVLPDQTVQPFATLNGRGVATGVTYVPRSVGGVAGGKLLATNLLNLAGQIQGEFYTVDADGNAVLIAATAVGGRIFTPALSPPAFGEFGGHVFVGNPLTGDISALDLATLEIRQFARLAVAGNQREAGIRQLAFSPVGWAEPIDPSLGDESVLVVSMSTGTDPGQGGGYVAIVDQRGRLVAELTHGPNGTLMNPRGLLFRESELLIADIAEGHGWIVRATAEDASKADCNENGVLDVCEIENGISEDCNQNGVPDECDIASGVSQDIDGDGIPDECAFDLGDLNCDGEMNAFDIEPFILALFDPVNYASQYPDCDINLADINGDGDINAFDIEPFLGLLFP